MIVLATRGYSCSFVYSRIFWNAVCRLSPQTESVKKIFMTCLPTHLVTSAMAL